LSFAGNDPELRTTEVTRKGQTMRAALDARASTHDQPTLEMQVDAMAAYSNNRGWTLASRVKGWRLGAKDRPGRESLLEADRRREIDVVVGWLDHSG
jgi:putative DNA-invertase from lambdoid prophage Rac